MQNNNIIVYDEPEQWRDVWMILADRLDPRPTECDELITDTNKPYKYIASITYKHYPYLVVDHTVLDKTVLNRSFITNVLTYCFTKRDTIRSFVKSTNAKSIKFMNQLHFVNEGCYRKYFDDGSDFLIFSMFKEEWEKNPYNRVQ